MSQASAPQSLSPAEALLARLERLGAELWVESGALRFRAPRGVIDDEARRQIAEHRDAIVAALTRRAVPADARSGTVRIRPLEGGREPPLSFAQRRLWFLDQLDPGAPQYNIGSLTRIRAPIDLEALAPAVDDLCQRHQAFRTRIYAEGGVPRLEVLPRARIALEIVDCSSDPPADREAAVHAYGSEALRTSFDMAEGRLALIRMVRFAPDDHLLVFVIHHVVADGWSLDVVWRDLGELYTARAAGRAPSLAPLALQYVDYAAWEQENAQTKGFAEQVAFWRETLAGAPVLLEFPTDRPRAATGSTHGARHMGYLDAALVARLRKIARVRGATLFMALLAVWQTLLSRLSGQEDIVVGTPVATRDQEGLENLVGCFINNVPLRGDLSGAPSFEQMLDRTRQATLSAFRHSAVPFEMIVEAVNPPRTASYAPIFQTLFTLMDFQGGEARPGGEIEAVPIDGDTGGARFDLSLELSFASSGPHAGDVLAAYEYDSDLFDEATIDRMHAQFQRLLNAACADPSAPLAQAPLVSPDEAALMAGAWNETGHDFDRGGVVPRLLAEAAGRTPEATAVRCGDEVLDYAAFEARSNRIARLLAARGAAPGGRVAVCLARGVDLPVALAAVMKTGAAYVPLDPAHPAERLGLVLGDADVVCIVTTSDLQGLFADADLLLLDEEAEAIDAAPDAPLDIEISPQSLAYLIYTSGSTGKPKGVEVAHANLAAFLEAMRLEPGLLAGEALLAVTTPSFDIAGLELWLPLTLGGEVVVASEMDAMDGEALADLIEAHDVRLLQATPTTWRLLLDAGWDGKPDLTALCGGEAMPLDLAQALLSRVGALWNVYGPTETTIWSAVHRVAEADLHGGRVPVGRPIANTRVYVLEPSGALAPIGAPGELVIAGEGVARGYRNLPDLTAEKFVEIAPFDRPERAYRTGDQARWRADATLDFLGRRDGQVKIRGFRIELGDIEAALAAHPAIRQAYVGVSDGPGGATLVAYLVHEAGQEPTTSELRRYLRARLPDYMVPALFVGIEAAPLSPNGKVDRRRLPDPFRTGKRAHKASEPPAPGIEQTLAEIWCEVLAADTVGSGDNFFELGGHSLLSLRVAAAVERRTGLHMDPRALFFQTLREVAAGLREPAGAA